MTGGLSLAELTAAIEQRSSGRLKARIEGDAGLRVSGLAPLATATRSDLGFLANPRYRKDALASGAGAIVLSPADLAAIGGASRAAALVVTDAAYAWFAFAAQLLHPGATRAPQVSAAAHIEAGAQIAASAIVDAGAFIGAAARVAERAYIGAGAVIAAGAVVGEETRIYPRAVVLENCVIGARAIVHSGAVIGADGFGFAPLDGDWIKIPQIGRVIIGDDVEIGANTTIDRGSMDDTVVENGVKLDNQIQIGHNCTIGARTVIAGCVGIAGSARIGRDCQIGGAAMIAGHLEIADGCVIGPGTLVSSSIGTRGHYVGYFPMMKNGEWQRAASIVRQLDNLRRRVRELEAAASGDAK
jgi:UDP-3-O-[3-hydroxymyristoyl] glucosamine N-acyltransferase